MLDQNWTQQPGGILVAEGIRDLEQGVESVPALLVSMATTQLRSLGLPVPTPRWSSPEFRLYALLEKELGDGAHSRYNALRRRLVSFVKSARCANR